MGEIHGAYWFCVPLLLPSLRIDRISAMYLCSDGVLPYLKISQRMAQEYIKGCWGLSSFNKWHEHRKSLLAGECCRTNADLPKVTGGSLSLGSSFMASPNCTHLTFKHLCFFWGREAFKFIFTCGVKSIWISMLLWSLCFRWWAEMLIGHSRGPSVRRRPDPICQRLSTQTVLPVLTYHLAWCH